MLCSSLCGTCQPRALLRCLPTAVRTTRGTRAHVHHSLTHSLTAHAAAALRRRKTPCERAAAQTQRNTAACRTQDAHATQRLHAVAARMACLARAKVVRDLLLALAPRLDVLVHVGECCSRVSRSQRRRQRSIPTCNGHAAQRATAKMQHATAKMQHATAKMQHAPAKMQHATAMPPDLSRTSRRSLRTARRRP
jgi:hypothetical protein